MASVLLVNGAAYITGNSKGLTSYFGLPSALGARGQGLLGSLESKPTLPSRPPSRTMPLPGGRGDR